jgi:acetolactate synthase regulatory subunit
MARIILDDDTVQLRFTTAEKVLGLVKNRDFPRSAVQSARVEQHALNATHRLVVGVDGDAAALAAQLSTPA